MWEEEEKELGDLDAAPTKSPLLNAFAMRFQGFCSRLHP